VSCELADHILTVCNDQVWLPDENIKKGEFYAKKKVDDRSDRSTKYENKQTRETQIKSVCQFQIKKLKRKRRACG